MVNSTGASDAGGNIHGVGKLTPHFIKNIL